MYLICYKHNYRVIFYTFSQICVAAQAVKPVFSEKCASPASDLEQRIRPDGPPLRVNNRPATLRNEKNLLRVGILDLATRLVAGYIDVTAVGIVRTENVPRFPRNRLRYWELRGAI